MKLARLAQIHLLAIHRPNGFNPGHTNFMTTVAEPRVLPESLDFRKAEEGF